MYSLRDLQKRSFHSFVHKLIPAHSKGRGSSVVERIIGNDEVGSSILPRGTSLYPVNTADRKRLDHFIACSLMSLKAEQIAFSELNLGNIRAIWSLNVLISG